MKKEPVKVRLPKTVVALLNNDGLTGPFLLPTHDAELIEALWTLRRSAVGTRNAIDQAMRGVVREGGAK